jgi:hypothetical protein
VPSSFSAFAGRRTGDGEKMDLLWLRIIRQYSA